MKQLKAQDTQFLYMETENSNSNAGMFCIFAPPEDKSAKLDQTTLVEHMKGRVAISDIFDHRLKRLPFNFDFPYLVKDPYFEIERHILYTKLPGPGTWEQLTKYLSNYLAKPFDMYKPLWELCMIDGLDSIEDCPKGSFAIFIKSHHAVQDGTSGARLLAGLMDRDANGTPVIDLSENSSSGKPEPTPSQLIARALFNNARAQVGLFRSIGTALPGAVTALTRKLVEKPDTAKAKVPDTRFNAPVSPNRQFDIAWFSLNELKQIKNHVEGATLNDVLLAMCGGALRRYLDFHSELPAESLVAWVPINVRPKEGAGSDVEGNQVGGIAVPLLTTTDNPLHRLTEMAQTTHRMKQEYLGSGAQVFTDITKHLPAYSMEPLTQLALNPKFAPRLCNLMLTNVPGPPEAFYLRGSKCLHLAGLAPIGDGMGLTIGAPSYNGEIGLTVITTEEMIPDMAFFIECLKDSFHEYKSVASSD